MYFVKNAPQMTQRAVQINQPQQHVSVENILGSLGGGIAFTLIWVGFLLMIVKIFNKEHNGKLVTLNNPLDNLPCNKCAYFSQNNYLKCAVQPSIVLTEESINCSDFCPQNLQNTENGQQVEQQKNTPY